MGPRSPFHLTGRGRCQLRNKTPCFVLATWRVLAQPACCPPVPPSSASPGEAPRRLACSHCNGCHVGTESWEGRGPAQGHTAGQGVRPGSGRSGPFPLGLWKELGVCSTSLFPRPYLLFSLCFSAYLYFLLQPFLCVSPLPLLLLTSLCLTFSVSLSPLPCPSPSSPPFPSRPLFYLETPGPPPLPPLADPPPRPTVGFRGASLPPSAQALPPPAAPAPRHRPSRGVPTSQEGPSPLGPAGSVSAAEHEPPPKGKSRPLMEGGLGLGPCEP